MKKKKIINYKNYIKKIHHCLTKVTVYNELIGY